MDAWWKRTKPSSTEKHVEARAVAYYRHSAQDRQENSIPIQRDQVREWAKDHDIHIIQEFADHGKSGLSAEHRDGFNTMLDDWVKKRDDFQYVLVLDVSRWGRFQDIDLSATYSSECTKHGKRVVYTSLGLPKKDDPFHAVFVGFERVRAAQYSRELSDKVFRGCAKIAEQGFRAGAAPPYGLHRVLLNEARRPVQVLKPRERKSIQNQRVTLGPGDEREVTVVRRIFEEYVYRKRSLIQIGDDLNREGIRSPGGSKWARDKVRVILTNEFYIGTMVYNKSSARLLSPTRRNPGHEWIRTPSAFKGIVSQKTFDRAQAKLEADKVCRTPEYVLHFLRGLYERRGGVTSRLIDADPDAPSRITFSRHFAGVDGAFQRLFPEAREEAIGKVRSKLKALKCQIEDYEDFIVLNGSLTVLVQPSFPVPRGYCSYWPFWPDKRPVVDITLGVPLSGTKGCDILGYVAFPRLLARERVIRISSADDPRVELFGHHGLEFITSLLSCGGADGHYPDSADAGPEVQTTSR